MKIGNGWTKTTENGDTYISISLDEIFGAWLPWLKNCYITLWHIPKDERKSENSPSWTLNISLKKEKQQDNTADDVPDFL